MNFFDVFVRILVIFFGLAAGYYAKKIGVMDSVSEQKISKLLLYITMPSMIVGTVIAGETLPEISEILSILMIAVIFYGLSIVVALIVPRFLGGTASQKGVWRFALTFPNVGFIGYPVVVALFGQEALFYAVILVMPFNMLSYSLGALMMTGAKRFSWKQLTSPCIVASAFALILALCRIRLPAILGEMLNFVGDITVPLSLLMVGSLLAGLPARQILGAPRLWVLSLIRLIVMPVLLWLVLRHMALPPMILGIAVAQMAMPVAVNGTLLCMEYGGDTEAMAQATFLSTLLSVVTIPLVASLLF